MCVCVALSVCECARDCRACWRVFCAKMTIAKPVFAFHRRRIVKNGSHFEHGKGKTAIDRSKENCALKSKEQPKIINFNWLKSCIECSLASQCIGFSLVCRCCQDDDIWAPRPDDQRSIAFFHFRILQIFAQQRMESRKKSCNLYIGFGVM